MSNLAGWDFSYPKRMGRGSASSLQRQEPPKVRSDLIRAVFRACDTNGDDWLGESEFRNIARASESCEIWHLQMIFLYPHMCMYYVPISLAYVRYWNIRIWSVSEYQSLAGTPELWRFWSWHFVAEARFYGFTGSEEKWSEEFKKLCEEKKVDPKKGIGRSGQSVQLLGCSKKHYVYISILKKMGLSIDQWNGSEEL